MRDFETTGYMQAGRSAGLTVAGETLGAINRVGIGEHISQTVQMAASVAGRAQNLAGRLVGHYSPKPESGGKNPEPGDFASQLEIANARVRGSLDEIVEALNRIEERLA